MKRDKMNMNFYPCPVGLHKGEMWESLRYRKLASTFVVYRIYSLERYYIFNNLTGNEFIIKYDGRLMGIAKLFNAEVTCSKAIKMEDIRPHLFHDMNLEDYRNLNRKFYGTEEVAFIKLYFSWVKIEGTPEEKPDFGNMKDIPYRAEFPSDKAKYKTKEQKLKYIKKHAKGKT